MSSSSYTEKLNNLWSDMLSNGMRDSFVNVSQICYLIFFKKLDQLQLAKEETASFFEIDVPDPIFTEYQDCCRFNVFKNYSPDRMFRNMPDRVFPYIRREIIITPETEFAKYMKDATFQISTPELLYSAVRLVDEIDWDDSKISSEFIKLLFSKLGSKPEKGQYRTDPELVSLICELTDLKIEDKICDPACGTGSLLSHAASIVYKNYNSEFMDQRIQEHFSSSMFTGMDIDSAMVLLSAMNLMLNNVSKPNLSAINSLSASNSYFEEFSVIMSNPPFSIETDMNYVSESIAYGIPTKSTAVLFFRLLMRMLKPNGRLAIIIPDVLLFGVKKAILELKKDMFENHRIDAIISLTDNHILNKGNISCSILVLTKCVEGGTKDVWFYNLDDKKDIPDLINRFKNRDSEYQRSRFDSSFIVSADEIIENNYMMVMNRYQKDINLEIHQPSSTSIHDLEIANSILKNLIYKL